MAGENALGTAASFAAPYFPIASGVLGLIQILTAKSKLDNMGKRPNYSVSPELQGAYNTAQDQARFGYTAGQHASFRAGVGQNLNTAIGTATDASGGSLGNALARYAGSAQLGAENKFAFDDANLQMHKQGTAYGLASAIQQQKNLASNADINNYNQNQTAWGGAEKAGFTNLGNSLNLYQAMGGGFNPFKGGQPQQPSGLAKDYSGSADRWINNPYGYHAPQPQMSNIPQPYDTPAGQVPPQQPYGDAYSSDPYGHLMKYLQGGFNPYNSNG